ncbi:MAG: C39 family peptidase [Desulfosalsimonadaceae bacterium]|nr:C39 family peptidase [Desulfosalsimonadaceae bacterium]
MIEESFSDTGSQAALTNAGIEEHEKSRREADSPLLGPGGLALLTLVAGPMISGPAAGAVLTRLGRTIPGWLTGLLLGAAGVAINIFMIFWPVKWYWAALSLIGIHVSLAAVLFMIMRKLYLRSPDSYRIHFSVNRRQGHRSVLAGMISGTIMSIIFGGMASVFFLLISDWLFYTFMPVAFNDWLSLTFFFNILFSLGISGCIAGGYIGKLGLKITPVHMQIYALALIWCSMTWLLAMQITIAVPGFQAGQAGSGAGISTGFPFLFGNLLIGIWWTPFLLIYLIRPAAKTGKLLRLAQIPFINLAAAIVLAILLGHPANMFHAAGRYFERQAQIPWALWCYEQGLKKNPAANTTSYLQYRVALLAHKLGDRERAMEGFRKVVSKYTANDELVKKSNRFLDSLARTDNKGKRIVLPGVEMRTAYKGAYCVPNSLALVMRYWGSSVDARKIGRMITGLGSGTMVVDQAWYAEKEGFRHNFLPQATIEDVKTCIDAGFPVMVYVPSHVFVIVGYDDTLETFVTYDVATIDVWEEYLYKDFIKSWKKQVTTLVLAYPPEKESLLPDSIRRRLGMYRDDYLHYHLNYLDTANGYNSVSHLKKAAKGKDGFFLPLVILYRDFPGLRPVIPDHDEGESVSKTIFNYFSNDFDEGTHLWGQIHYDEISKKDSIFDYSLCYLIGQRQLPLARELITRIEDQGLISENTQEIRAMIDMSLGDIETGVHRLKETKEDSANFYLALGEWVLDDREAAISDLVEAVDGCT